MKILVIGEQSRDIFVYGNVSRLNPEAPTPIFNPIEEVRNDGMAGNVAANILSLRPNFETQVLHQYVNITKKRYVDKTSGYIMIRVDEDNPECVMALEFSVFDAIDLGHYNAIVVSDYAKGFLHPSILQSIVTKAKNHRVPTYIDTKQILGVWSEQATFIKINKKEYLLNEKSLRLPPEHYCENLILTLGVEGAQWRKRGAAIRHSAVKPVEVHSVAGAGDSFLAGFVVKHLETGSAMEAMDYANSVARVAVSKRGVVAVKAEEIH